MLGGAGLQVTLFLTGILLARALGPENRGYMALLTLVAAIAWQLGGLGIPYALTYSIARVPTAAARIVASVRGPIALQAILASVAAGIVLALLTYNDPSYVQIGAAMTAASVAPAVFRRCELSVLQGLREFKTFNLWRLAPNGSFALMALFLLALGVTDFLPYAAGWALSRSLFTLGTRGAALRATRVAETGEGDPPTRPAILRFGRKAMFGGAPPVETYRVDQSVVALFLAPTALGYYVAALAFTNLPRFIAQSFGIVASPIVARQPTHALATRAMWRFFWLSLPFSLVAVVPLWLAAPTLATFLFGAEFAVAGEVSRNLLIATSLFCARRVLADAARGAGYPGLGSIAEVFAFISVVPLFAVFVPAFGLDGVAYSLVASSALAFTILVGGLLRARSAGTVPPAWREIHDAPPGVAPVATGDVVT